MKPIVATATAIALLLAGPTLAATDTSDSATDTAAEAASEDAAGTGTITPTGDAAAGETVFAKQCVTCHVVVNDEGETLAGNRGRQGPNLYGVAGGSVAAVEDFKYGPGMAEAGDTGAVWDEENFVVYVQDPTAWLRATSGDPKARSRMSWKVRDEQDAKDIFAFLYELGPHEAE